MCAHESSLKPYVDLLDCALLATHAVLASSSKPLMVHSPPTVSPNVSPVPKQRKVDTAKGSHGKIEQNHALYSNLRMCMERALYACHVITVLFYLYFCVSFVTGFLTPGLPDLVQCDTSVIESVASRRQNPQDALIHLFDNAYQLLIPILDPYFVSVQKRAMDKLKPLNETERQRAWAKRLQAGVTSAKGVQDLLLCQGLAWNDVNSLQSAILCITKEAQKDTAEAILCHYRNHLNKYCKAVNILNGKTVLRPHTGVTDENMLTMEITVEKDVEEYTTADCLQLWTKFLIETLPIPDKNIRYVEARQGCTILVFEVSQQYATSIKKKLREGRVVCVMLLLRIVRLRIPGVNCDMDLRALAPQELSANIRAGLQLESNVDFISLTQLSYVSQAQWHITCRHLSDAGTLDCPYTENVQ